MRHTIENHALCQMGTFTLAVWGARHRGTLGLLAVGASALILGYELGRSVAGTQAREKIGTDRDATEPTPESAELGSADAGPP